LTPEVAFRVRELLAAKEFADAAGRRRITRELQALGFRVADLAEHVPRRRGGFAAEDLDALIARGVVRVGRPDFQAQPAGPGR
ncbi:MAG TPA: hypothetical protein VGR10_07175, partial [Thermoleophilaceae bacterium]|nr:hypothetical protein [Thermoleophilaceae bacterium]